MNDQKERCRKCIHRENGEEGWCYFFREFMCDGAQFNEIGEPGTSLKSRETTKSFFLLSMLEIFNDLRNSSDQEMKKKKQ